MKSFRSEIEDPVVEKDLVELGEKIHEYRFGKMPEEKFKALRLARGVYGQRQQGVQMVRIKLPYGRMTVRQLLRIADVSDEYATGNLHTTTRQDIQLHYVNLDRTPELWEELEKDQVTMREACGNTVRNVTASALAGVDPDEPFDVTPYTHEVFRFFLRNPICQDMGRKFKIALSSSEKDTAFTFIHDIGLIPKVREKNGQEERGFKVLVGGGLGARPFMAKPVYEFLPEEEVIPFAEAAVRVFDRYGERARRMKARLKFLIEKIGIEEFLELVEKEKPALQYKRYPVDREIVPEIPDIPEKKEVPSYSIEDEDRYAFWKESNVMDQKQDGYKAVQIRLKLGDISSDTARELAGLVREYAGDDIRVSQNQGLVLRFVREEYLPYIYSRLDELDLASPGFDSIADITACPGTDTCNLGISSSTGIAQELEKVIEKEYPRLVKESDIKIKISGCMNSCGQHGIANIGFHGASVKVGKLTAPGLQVLLGGGLEGDGAGRPAEKILVVPSKRGPKALRTLLDDYQSHAETKERFNAYFDRQGKNYFRDLLKPLADKQSIEGDEFIDWGRSEQFETQVGTGECAGVTIDLVSTLIYEAQEKLEAAENTLKDGHWSDAIYHSFNTLVQSAKALLVGKEVKTNSHSTVISGFDEHFIQTGEIKLPDGVGSFEELAHQLRDHEPTETFAKAYFEQARTFNRTVEQFRKTELDETV